MPLEQPPAARWPLRLALLIILMLVLVIGTALWYWQAAPSPSAKPVEERIELVERKTVAAAKLENERFGESADFFEEIVEQAPDERMPLRNLVIGRLMALDEVRQQLQMRADPEEEARQMQAAIDRAHRAAQRLIELQPDSPVTWWLAARIELQAGGEPAVAEQRAADLLHRGMETDPHDLPLRFALFRLSQVSEDPDVQQSGRDALQAAFQHDPHNFALLRLWLLEQARQEDSAVTETIDQTRTAIQPLARRTAIDLEGLLDQAAQAVVEGEWQMAQRALIGFDNVVKADDFAKSDLAQIDPNPLEFVQHWFSDDFYHGLPDPEWDASAAIDIRLLPAQDGWQLPEVDGPQDVKLVDLNLDGYMDVVVLERDGVRVFGQRPDEDQNGDGWKTLAEHAVGEGFQKLVVADLFLVDSPQAPKRRREGAEASNDHDTLQSIVVYGEGGLRVLRTEMGEPPAGLQLVDVTEQTELPADLPIRALVAVDLDHDGDLDLVLATEQGISLWTNRGNMTFMDTTGSSVLPPAQLPFTSLVAVDWDRDVDLDVVAMGPQREAAGVLENMRHGQFRWRPFDDYPDLLPADSIALLDADGNASWDLLAAGPDGLQLLLTSTIDTGVVAPRGIQQISDEPFSGVLVWDFDNDGYLDCIAWREDHVQIFRGRGAAGFEAIQGLFEQPPPGAVAVDVGDINADGGLDVVVATGEELLLYFNEGANQNRWLAVRVRGVDDVTQSGRVNHYGLGSLLELKAGLRYQAHVVDRPVTHFGLGPDTDPDVLRLMLTNGIPQAVIHPEPNQVIREQMVLKGSCPFLYVWNGERFEFFTDLLWAAPLGLQSAEGQVLPARPWEYLLIPGDKLQRRDGFYELRITEELWEVAYFDHVQLLAVDHLPDIEVFSNEKVGPPDIAEFQIHTVRQRRYPASVRDPQGRDLTRALASADQQYVRTFERTVRQGLVEPTYLELDLGALDHPQQITLFLTGWIQPTDTSLNIAISQNPDLQPPAPPSVWVPTAEGLWQEAIPFMGFPGGKPKTIAVDLSGIFPTDDYRLRIKTSAQIYWDEVFFTVDEEPGEYQIKPLPLESAELRYRGFSAHLPRGPNDPELFDYDRVETEPRWPPIQGRFTRYGNVASLLAEVDDRMVVMGPGDELVLRFAPPEEPLPGGWTRDFILHNHGWDKDADLNTIYGQSVEPMPFADQGGDPFESATSPPDTPEYREYLESYQTREQDFRAFWHLLGSP